MGKKRIDTSNENDRRLMGRRDKVRNMRKMLNKVIRIILNMTRTIQYH